MDMNKYRRLPESITAEELDAHWRELLDAAEQGSFAQSEEMALAFYELAQRQWHTARALDEGIQSRLENWVFQVWNPGSRTLVRNVVFISVYTGLPNSHLLLRNPHWQFVH